MWGRGKDSVCVILAVVIAVTLAPASAAAATIEVEIRTDEFANNGDCSLREAAQAANLDSLASQFEQGCRPGNGADVIDLDAGSSYTLTTPIDGSPAIDDGDVELTDPDGVTLLGEGRSTTIVDGGDHDRVLEVTAGNMTLNAATVRNGTVATPDGGGAILSAGDLSLVAAGVTESQQTTTGGGGGGIALTDEAALTASGDTIVNDNASAGAGGGIYKLDDGDITLNAGVNVDRNDAVGFGGGIFVSGNSAALAINGASVSNNDLTENVSQQAWGSAIYFGSGSAFSTTRAQIVGNDAVGDKAGAALDMFSLMASTIDASTISNNTATGQVDANGDVLSPAAIRVNNSAGLTISDSTVSQNTVTDPDIQDVTTGAGIYAIAGPLTITGSTIASNSLGGDGTSQGGGGLYIEQSAPTSVLNSTFTGNIGPDFGGGISMQHNGDLTVVQSTFSGNVSTQGAAINTQGGVGSVVSFRGSVFDDGMSACSFGSPSGLTANSFNVDAGQSCVGAPGDSDFEDTDAQLEGLADNGGPTETMRLMGPTGLFDAAGSCKQLDGTTDLLVDQRGYPRPREGGCEPGAYERFVCRGSELMQPGPFPGCAPPPVAGGTGGTGAVSPPSNAFDLVKLKRNPKNGTAILFVQLPGPGEIGLDGPGIKEIGIPGLLAQTSRSVSGGRVKLKIRPAKKGKAARRLRERLDEKGKARRRVEVTYVPAGGAPNTLSRKVKLIEK